MNKNILLSVVLLTACNYNSGMHIIKITSSTCDPPYIIEIPEKIQIDNTNQFKIYIKENNLSSSQKIELCFDKDFIMSDSYGKEDVYGQIINDKIEADNSTNEIAVNYNIGELSAGKWSSNLRLNISLVNDSISNMLIDGPSLNSLILDLGIKNITFSNDVYTSSYENINNQPYIDISDNQDESVLLYKSTKSGFTITSNGGECIYANPNSSSMFESSAITKFTNSSLLDTSFVSNMNSMFKNCSGITSLDVSYMNTSNVLDMSYMFSNCQKLRTLTGLTSFNTSKVNNMSHMFENCNRLSNIKDVEGFNVDNVQDMSSMFENYSSTNTTYGTIDLDLTDWNLSNIVNMNSMFKNVNLLNSVSFSSTNTSNLLDISNMFSNCLSISCIDISSFDVSSVIDMSHLFNNCQSLVHLSSINDWDVSSVTNMSYMFNEAWNININEAGDLKDWDPTSCINFNNIFNGSPYASTQINWLQ